VLRNDVPDFTIPVPLTNMLRFFVVITDFIFIKGTDWYFNDIFAIRGNNALLANQVWQVIFNGVFYLIHMTLLILISFPVEGPIFLGDGKLFLFSHAAFLLMVLWFLFPVYAWIRYLLSPNW